MKQLLEYGLLTRKLSCLSGEWNNMGMLKTEDWYDLARTTTWTPRYVSGAELFPPDLSDVHGLPDAAFDAFDEPYKVTFRDYVRTQREKDVGAYSVRAALARGRFYQDAPAGWQALLQLHFGAATFLEYGSVSAFARVTRFGKAGGMRNMATFGSLDEIRHTQVHLRFAHDYLRENRAFDWAHKSPRTDNWVIISERHTFDDIEHTRDATSFAVMTNFAFETCFTNLQFVALSADAARSGDHSFATMLQTIQSDEARHSQIGEPLLRILIDHGKEAEAQKLLDISFWRCWKQFSPLSGICMDYYTPLEHREHSFKEFMQEWVSEQFIRRILDLGLSRPWYWDIFLEDLETFHHAQQIGVYLYRPTEWWHPVAGVDPAEREWLEEKYPGWNATFGTVWDVIIDNILNGRTDATIPGPLPMICNMSGFELTGVPNGKVVDYTLDYKGRRYHFGSEVDRWIFEQDPERYAGHRSIVDRYVARVMPQTAEDVLNYMGMSGPERGTDGTSYAWVEPYRRERGKAA